MREKSDVGVSLFGKPLLLSLPAEVSHGDLYKVILERKSRFVRQTARQEEGNIKQKEDESGDELCLQLQEDDSSDEMESRLYTISLVDKYGHSRTQASQEDTISRDSSIYLALDWTKTGRQFYTEKRSKVEPMVKDAEKKKTSVQDCLKGAQA
jgi:hypothetical protein